MALGYFIYNKTTKKEENKNSNQQQEKIEYSYEENNNYDITFYKNNEKINEFKCNGKECEIDLFNYNDIRHNGSHGEERTYIKDDKVVGVKLEDDIKVLELLSGEIRLISADGKINRTAKPDIFKFTCYEECYLPDYNYEKI